jgi:hypothetical protein
MYLKSRDELNQKFFDYKFSCKVLAEGEDIGKNMKVIIVIELELKFINTNQYDDLRGNFKNQMVIWYIPLYLYRYFKLYILSLLILNP